MCKHIPEKKNNVMNQGSVQTHKEGSKAEKKFEDIVSSTDEVRTSVSVSILFPVFINKSVRICIGKHKSERHL